MCAETENHSPVSGSPHIEKFATTTAVMIADCPGRMDKIATCSKREPQGKSKGLPALPQTEGRPGPPGHGRPRPPPPVAWARPSRPPSAPQLSLGDDNHRDERDHFCFHRVFLSFFEHHTAPPGDKRPATMAASRAGIMLCSIYSLESAREKSVSPSVANDVAMTSEPADNCPATPVARTFPMQAYRHPGCL